MASSSASAQKASESSSKSEVNNRIAISKNEPSPCTESSYTYTTAQQVETGQVMLDPMSLAWTDCVKDWKFTVGEVATVKQWLLHYSPHVADASKNDPPVSNNDGTYTFTPKEGSVSVPMSAVTIPKDPANSLNGVTFLFKVETSYKCNKPVAQNCTDTNYQLTTEQWNAYEVDKFLEQQITKWKGSGNDNFYKWFKDTYV